MEPTIRFGQQSDLALDRDASARGRRAQRTRGMFQEALLVTVLWVFRAIIAGTARRAIPT